MLGRFLSPDPIGIAGGINLYAYAGNDPLNLVDRVGLGAGPSAPNGYGGTWSWQWGSHGHGGGWGPGGGSGDDGNGPGGPCGPGDGLGADSAGGTFPGGDIGPNNQGGQSGFAMAAAEAGPETPGEAGIAPAAGFVTVAAGISPSVGDTAQVMLQLGVPKPLVAMFVVLGDVAVLTAWAVGYGTVLGGDVGLAAALIFAPPIGAYYGFVHAQSMGLAGPGSPGP